eukprot:Opistho-2@88708
MAITTARIDRSAFACMRLFSCRCAHSRIRSHQEVLFLPFPYAIFSQKFMRLQASRRCRVATLDTGSLETLCTLICLPFHRLQSTERHVNLYQDKQHQQQKQQTAGSAASFEV